MRYPAFVGGGYTAQSPISDDERLVNWFFERAESQGATSESSLYPVPGVQKISSTTAAPGRANFAIAGVQYVVQGTAFNEVSSTGTITNRGTVAIGDNPATISSNGDGGDELFITSGTNGYCYNRTTHVFTQITALNGKATMGAALDGYFLNLDGNTSTFYISDLLDGLTWDPTMFAQRTIASDPWIAMKVNGRYVWLDGEETSEVWYDSGQGNFPFAPHPSGLVQYGTAAAFSVAAAEGQKFWLGRTAQGAGMVLRANGFTPEVISDYALQWAISQYSRIDDAVAETFNYAGHLFYRLSFPSEDKTWCWDSQLSKWFEWETWIAEQNAFTCLRTRFHAFVYGEHRFLDTESGAIYRMGAQFGTDVDQRPIRRVRRAPTLESENQRVFYQAFELSVEPGLGLPPDATSDLPVMELAVGLGKGLIPDVDFYDPGGAGYAVVIAQPRQGWNPQVMLRTSNDGGKTWSNERWASAGKSGEYSKRVRWERCGQGRRRVFEVSTSDPIPFRITDAYLRPTQERQAMQQARA